MYFEIYSKSLNKLVAYTDGQNLETAIKRAKTQAKLFTAPSYDPDDLFVCSCADPKNRELTRYGFVWVS